jgi:hypothetical protein
MMPGETAHAGSHNGAGQGMASMTGESETADVTTGEGFGAVVA